MALSRTRARILRDLSLSVSKPEAQCLLRRGLRIASLLDGDHPDEEILESVCNALAQEGSLVQELIEELVSRLATRPGPKQTPSRDQPKRTK